MIALVTALAGGLGAAARFLLDTTVARSSFLTMPIGTLLVNITSCFLLGLLTGLVISDPRLAEIRHALGVGFLGGYSTFSTASVEGVRLLREGRFWAATVHSGGMLLACVIAAMAGLVLTSR